MSLHPVFHFALNKSCWVCLSTPPLPQNPWFSTCLADLTLGPIQPWVALPRARKQTEITQSFLGLCTILPEPLVSLTSPQPISNHLYSLSSWSGPLLIIRFCLDPLQAPHDSDLCDLSFSAVPLLSLVQAVLPPPIPSTPRASVPPLPPLVIGSPARNFPWQRASWSSSPPSEQAPSYETFLQAPPTPTPSCPSPLCSLHQSY